MRSSGLELGCRAPFFLRSSLVASGCPSFSAACGPVYWHLPPLCSADLRWGHSGGGAWTLCVALEIARPSACAGHVAELLTPLRMPWDLRWHRLFLPSLRGHSTGDWRSIGSHSQSRPSPISHPSWNMPLGHQQWQGSTPWGALWRAARQASGVPTSAVFRPR